MMFFYTLECKNTCQLSWIDEACRLKCCGFLCACNRIYCHDNAHVTIPYIFIFPRGLSLSAWKGPSLEGKGQAHYISLHLLLWYFMRPTKWFNRLSSHPFSVLEMAKPIKTVPIVKKKKNKFIRHQSDRFKTVKVCMIVATKSKYSLAITTGYR